MVARWECAARAGDDYRRVTSMEFRLYNGLHTVAPKLPERRRMKHYLVFFEGMDEPQVADEHTLATLIGREDYETHTEFEVSREGFACRPIPGAENVKF